MAQHFFLSSPVKSLGLGRVFRMTEQETEPTFAKVRWIETNGARVRPQCAENAAIWGV
jgi:hypothetical protein